MDINKLFYAYEESIPQINEVDEAETTINMLNKRLKAIDSSLAEEFDTAVGRIAWAYEKQGFVGGIAVANGII